MRKFKVALGLFCLLSLSSPLSAQQSVDPGDGIPDTGLFVEGSSLELTFAGKVDGREQKYLVDVVARLLEGTAVQPLTSAILKSPRNIETSRLNSRGEVVNGVRLVTEADIEAFNGFIEKDLSNEKGLISRDLLNRMFVESDQDSGAFLAKYLEYISYGLISDPGSSALSGVGGTATIDFILNVCAYLNQPECGPVRYRPGKTVDFHRNEDGSGRMEVVGVETHYYTKSNRLYKKIIRDWKIQIAPEGFKIFHRDDGNISDPFPDAPAEEDQGRLPDFMKDREDIRSVWGRNLITKVHAAGLKVEVTQMSEREQTMQSGQLVETDKTVFENGSNDHHVLIPSEESCVDYLFDSDPPPTSHHEFPDQRGYCLGRCASPDIINSF